MSIKKNKITHRIKEATLQKFISAIFQKCKLSKKDADIVSNGLVRADMRGVWSHGVVRTSVYCNRILKKAANPKPNIKFKNIQKKYFSRRWK